MNQPYVTIAMPCRNEVRFIEACLSSVQAQTYPRDRIEVLVADGGSTDGTRQILARLAAEDDRIRVIDNPDRIQAVGLNRVLDEARGDVIVRMDVHCEYALDYVEKCVEVLERTGANNVGGAQRCRGRTEFESSICAALNSPLGVGGAEYRKADNEGYVDTVFLGAYRRRVFDQIGAWDPDAITNEDAELNQRLVAAGGRIYLSREIVVHYSPRSTLPALARQYFRYGQGRARTLVKHGRFVRMRPALPFLTLIGALVAIVFAPGVAAVGGVAYAILVGVEAARQSRRCSASVLLTSVAFPIMHVCHAVGFGVGLIASGFGSTGKRP